MTAFTPVYRATVFASDGVTPLTPIGGAPHSDNFKIATATGVTGFSPYLDWPQGRRGRVDFLSRVVDTGSLTLRVLDVRNTPGGSNLSRWVTAFVGTSEGQEQIAGKAVLVEESHDGGSTYRDYFTGRVQAVQTDGRLWINLQVTDNAEDLNRRIFVGLPHPSASQATATPLFPLGLSDAFGGMTTVPKAKATLSTGISGIGFGPRATLVIDGDQFRQDRTNPDGDIMTRSLFDALTRAGGVLGQSLAAESGLRVRIKILSGGRSGEEGHLLLKGIAGFGDFTFRVYRSAPDGDGHHRLTNLSVQEISHFFTPLTGDPNYIAMPANGTSVEFDIVGSAPPTENSPILINDIHPFQLLKDLLDGYYGRREDGLVTGTFGDPAWTVSYDTTEMANRISDTTWGTGRYIIPETVEDMREWIEELGKSYGFGYYLDASGDFRSIDLRRPTTAAGAPTVNASNLDVTGAPPSWIHTREDAVTRVIVNYYVDTEIERSAIASDTTEYPDIPPSTIRSVMNTLVVANFSDPDLPENDLEIEALGFRAFVNDADEGQSEIQRIEAALLKMIEELKGPFRAGSSQFTIPLRRDSGGFLAFTLGDMVILDIDEIPDPSTNLRGGARLVRCGELTEEGPKIIAGFVDLGINATAGVPTLGTLVLTVNAEAISIDVPITVNAAGEPVQVEFAITPTATGTRPVEGSDLWRYALTALSTETRRITDLPSGLRIWVRGRTLPQDADALKIPSAWVFPSNSKLDLTSLPTISGGGSGSLTGSTALLSWTNGSDEFPIEVHLKQGAAEQRIERLPSGSSEYLVEFLEVSTSYTVRLRYVDGLGGRGAFHDIAFSTTGTLPTAPDLRGMVLLVGRAV